MRVLAALLSAVALTLGFAPPVQAAETGEHCQTAEAYGVGYPDQPRARFCLKVWHSPNGLDTQRIDRIRLCKDGGSGRALDFVDFVGAIRDQQGDVRWNVGSTRWTKQQGDDDVWECRNWYPQQNADAPARVNFTLDATWIISGTRYEDRIWLLHDRLGTNLG